ncbi:MAG: hypothetical protein JNL16_13490 [Dechloromonas sp.]|uniref:hypothetical protein n=1 Tax=Dechloromonas sp. CZR5 TaxID=2608630 RepID=UPI00123DBCF5|nr:hypothetical protein [Dechloromonas sp. CZR5]MBL8405552.1 hypothetical protein [Dechloromonas sp.]
MNRRVMLSVVLPLLLAACAFGYHARGTLSGISGELRGKAFPGNAQGGGRFALADPEGRLRCEGEMAPSQSATPSGSCEGETGHGIVRCSDGRVMAARWTAISCRAFRGDAEDEQGNRLEFRVERRR